MRSILALSVYSLWWREIRRFLRQRSRVLGAIGQPLVFWILLGAGLGNAFQLPASFNEMSYLEYLFPGIMVLIVLFTAIFSTISLIQDRNSGFLQSILVAPMPRSGLVLGKMFGSTTLALVQAGLLLLLTPLMGLDLPLLTVLQILGVLFLLAFALSGLGYLIAWPLDTTQGFHAIMNLLLIPMWLLSGAFFPAEGLPSWLSWILLINPLTYGVDLLRSTLYHQPGEVLSWTITLVFCLSSFAGALFITRWRTHRGGPNV